MTDDIHSWLLQFAEAVRERDFARGRRLFAPEVIGFGTRTTAAHSLDALVEQQWTPIWNSTRDFAFELPPIRSIVSADGLLATVLVLWKSRSAQSDLRSGRCTLVLQRSGDGKLLAIHSHFSRTPNEPSTGDLT